MTKDSKDTGKTSASKGSTLRDRIMPLPPEDQKRLANWRIFSINTSPQPTKDSPTSSGSEEEKIPPNPRESASQESLPELEVFVV